MRSDRQRDTWTSFPAKRFSPPTLPSAAATNGSSQRSARFASPFASGNEKFAPHAIYTSGASVAGTDKLWQVRVVPNRAPILRVEGDPATHADGFYDRMDGVGAHEIIVEDSGAASLE